MMVHVLVMCDIPRDFGVFALFQRYVAAVIGLSRDYRLCLIPVRIISHGL